MKTLILGDTHGRSEWKDYINQTQPDRVVFIGDYFDSFDVPITKQIDNFLDIVQYKQDNLNEVILLFGNHDFHYIIDGENYSGYATAIKVQVETLLKDLIRDDILQMCYSQDDYLFSHAGITQTWVRNQGLSRSKNLVVDINNILKYKPYMFLFRNNVPQPSIKKLSAARECIDWSGDNKEQSPIWVRPFSLKQDMLKGDWWQIVGHTHSDQIVFHNGYRLTVVDAMPNEALLIEENVQKVVKLFHE
jgi:hypothetical protein